MASNEEILNARYLVNVASGQGMLEREEIRRMAEMELSDENPVEPVLIEDPEALDPTVDDSDKVDHAHTQAEGLISPSGFKSLASMGESRLRDDFTFHPAKPGGEAAGRHDQILGLCLAMAKELDELLPAGRDKSLAFTKLEEVMHRANAAIAKADLDHVTG